MTRHVYSRYRVWQSIVPRDETPVVADRCVPRSLVVLATLPLVLLNGFAKYVSMPEGPQHVSNREVNTYFGQGPLPHSGRIDFIAGAPQTIPQPDPPTHPVQVIPGYDAPHKWGQVWNRPLPEEAPEVNTPRETQAVQTVFGYSQPHTWGIAKYTNFLPVVEALPRLQIVAGYSQPHLWGSATYLKRTADQGPERTFNRFVFVQGYDAPNKNGSVWIQGLNDWSKGIIDLNRLAPIQQAIQPPLGPMPYGGRATFISELTQLDANEFEQNKISPTEIAQDPNLHMRSQRGSYWFTGLNGREDPPTNQQRLSPVIVSSGQIHPSQISKSFAFEIPRVTEPYDEALRSQPIVVLSNTPWQVWLAKSFYQPASYRDVEKLSPPSVMAGWAPRPTSYTAQIVTDKDDERTFEPTVVLATNRSIPGYVYQIQKIQVQVFGMTRPSSLLRSNRNPALTNSFTSGYIGKRGLTSTVVTPVNDFVWKVKEPFTGWTTRLVGSDDCACELPWSFSLASGWTLGEPTQ